MMCLCKTAGVRWQDSVPNTEVLKISIRNMNGMKTFLLSAQFRWSGHLVRMNDDRILKAVTTKGIRKFTERLKEKISKTV